MASTSAPSGLTESEPATTSQGVPQSSSSSSSPSCSRSLFSCCLDWVSLFPSWRSMESNSMASTSYTTGCVLQNEAFQEMAPPVTTSNTTGCIPQNEEFQERAPPATVSDSSGYIPENESFQEMARSASTSGSSGCIPENEVMGASQEMTPSTSTSGIPQDEVSTPSGRTESEPATTSQGVAQFTSNSTGCILQNEAFQEMAPPVTPQNEEFQEMAPPATASDTTCYIPENESFQEMAPSASTSGASGCIPEGEIMGASQEMTTPASTSGIPENEAFQGMAPSASDMGRSSTLIQKPCYDVFINHRGPDVKETLASKIYNILCYMKVPTFLDSEELDYGDFFPETLKEAIGCATLHIAIFSKGYAESAWCLEELSLMLRSRAKIIPIFYHVDPTDLRYVDRREGVYVDAFNKHKEKGRYQLEKLEEWKDALRKVSFYTGEIINNNNDAIRVFKKIVNIVSNEISTVPRLVVAKHLAGLNETVNDFEKALELAGGDEGVQIVGIWGIGGSGKTTLAKELFNQRSLSMDRSSFIFDIRAAKGLLQKKQSELLKDLGVNEAIDNVEQGKAILARHLRSFRVLIVMDDVDHVDQLDALLPVKDNLRNGSLIIVTTRDYEVLTSWGISSVYKIKVLIPSIAKQLFCWHAFLQPFPPKEFQELVDKFTKVCNGIPLLLEVFGAQLYGNFSEQSWNSLIDKILRIWPMDIKATLRISYDALDDEEKEAFLDIACFFIGEENSLAVEVWDGSNWSGLHIWRRLLNRCLVEVDDKNCIRMHDHLRDLGLEMANQRSPSRIWLPKQIIHFGKQIEKISNTRGIKVAPTGMEELLSYREALTPYFVGLKLLVIEGDYFSQEIGEVSRDLVWLRWSDFGQRNLARISLKNLRVLQLYDSGCLEELWEAESDAPVQLRELIISGCPKFQRFPNSIGCLHKLKKIVFEGYKTNVESLPEEFCRLQKLEHLSLINCRKLSSLPSNFGNLTNLRYLDLTECQKLRELPTEIGQLGRLQTLDIGCHSLISLPNSLGDLSSLTHLSIRDCYNLESLPISVGDLFSLTYLRILHCPNLESLPTSLGDLFSLTNLEIENCPKLKCLPFSVGRLSRLEHLHISSCPMIQVDLEAAPSSSALSNMKRMKILWT